MSLSTIKRISPIMNLLCIYLSLFLICCHCCFTTFDTQVILFLFLCILRPRYQLGKKVNLYECHFTFWIHFSYFFFSHINTFRLYTFIKYLCKSKLELSNYWAKLTWPKPYRLWAKMCIARLARKPTRPRKIRTQPGLISLISSGQAG